MKRYWGGSASTMSKQTSTRSMLSRHTSRSLYELISVMQRRLASRVPPSKPIPNPQSLIPNPQSPVSSLESRVSSLKSRVLVLGPPSRWYIRAVLERRITYENQNASLRKLRGGGGLRRLCRRVLWNTGATGRRRNDSDRSR